MKIYHGGFKTYGHAVGILMLDTLFPRVPGDMGNATSFSYPVIYHTIKGAPPTRVVKGDPALLEPFIEGAKHLEKSGARLITTNCGFLAVFQREMAAAVNVPVFTSSLIQVPLVAKILGPNKRVGILTANAKHLSEAHYEGVGWSSSEIRIGVQGMEGYPAFTNFIFRDDLTMDFDAVAAEVVDASKRLCAAFPDVGAVVFECTNLPPYASLVQEAIGLPVFDIMTLTDMAYRSAFRLPYEGHM